MTREQREYIDHLIQIYLNGLQSLSNDAGWEGSGIMGKIVEFAGDLPPPSGNDQSNLSMINAIRLLRERHAKWPVIAGSVAVMMRSRVWRPQILALLAKHHYVGQCPWTEKAWTDAQRAAEVGQRLGEYRYNLGKSYDSFQQQLDFANIIRGFVDR